MSLESDPARQPHTAKFFGVEDNPTDFGMLLASARSVVMGALLHPPKRIENEYATPPPGRALPAFQSWHDLPDLICAECVDVRHVSQRLGIYKLLIEQTGRPEVMGRFGENQIWWGYAAQLNWQKESGRLNPACPSDKILEQSWWGKMNYSLCVIPLVAAMNVGSLPRLRIEGDEWTNQERDFLFGRAILKWEEFFRQLQLADDPQQQRKLEHFAWDAHMASLSVAKDVAKWDFRRMPQHEQCFARGWVRLVRVLDSIDMPTDLVSLGQMGALPLPPRALCEREPLGKISDFNPAQNALVQHLVEWGSTPRMVAYPAQWAFDRGLRMVEGLFAAYKLWRRGPAQHLPAESLDP